MEVALWLADAGGLLAEAAAEPQPWLSPAEQARRDAITHPQRCGQFTAGRWGLRRLLAAAVGGAPAQWTLDAPADAAPAVAAGPLPFSGRLSLAHSGNLVLCALAEGRLGVDIESGERVLRDPDGWLGFACTPAERHDCMAVADAARPRRLLMHWTAKEAFGKARGTGLPFEALQRTEALPAAAQEANVWIGAADAAVVAVHGASGLPALRWFAGAEQAADWAWSTWQVRSLTGS